MPIIQNMVEHEAAYEHAKLDIALTLKKMRQRAGASAEARKLVEQYAEAVFEQMAVLHSIDRFETEAHFMFPDALGLQKKAHLSSEIERLQKRKMELDVVVDELEKLVATYK